VIKGGTYVLILQFAELYFYEPGARVFNIKFGDFKVVENLDIYEKVGRFGAYDEYIEFELKDDEVFYKGQLCSNAFKFKEKKLIVEFEKTDRDLPKVDGLILFKGKLAETNYEYIQEKRKEWAEEIELSKIRDDKKGNILNIINQVILKNFL